MIEEPKDLSTQFCVASACIHDAALSAKGNPRVDLHLRCCDPIDAALTNLSSAETSFQRGDWLEGITLILNAVRAAREHLTWEGWLKFSSYISRHPIAEILREDPFTRHGFEKPRGYAGDAVLIDYIYGSEHLDNQVRRASTRGRWIYNYTVNSSAGCAVRRRKAVIAQEIDAAAMRRPGCRVASLACGHIRELQESHAIRARMVDTFIGLDQDELSLAQVRTPSSCAIELVNAAVNRVVAGRIRFEDLDLVYSAGLFDYLNAKYATRLTHRMYDMIKPGGVVLIANFLRGMPDAAYMEAFMDWRLLYRSRAEILALAAGLDATVSYVEEAGVVGYLHIQKEGGYRPTSAAI